MKIKIVQLVMDKTSPVIKPVMFQIKKHLPEILVGTGVVSVAGGTVLACKATIEVKDILEKEISESEDETEMRQLALEQGTEIAKAYLPGVGLVCGGVGMLIAAKSIEHRRFTAALGAYSAMQAAFEEYRNRIISEAGPDVDKKARYGCEAEKVSYSEVDEESGKKKKTKEEVLVHTSGENPYHRLFDEYNSPMNWQDNLEDNRFFLECQQTVLNQELNRDGRIFLNDVYKRLGFDYDEVGQFVGWLASDIEGSRDGYIDFGIDYTYMMDEVEAAQLEGRKPEPSIWLNFNCDGEVWDKPLKKKRETV